VSSLWAKFTSRECLTRFPSFIDCRDASGIVLTGFPPYDQASRTDQRFELIVSGRLMEQLRNWDIFLTDEAGDLMQNMLQLDPRERLTLAEVMSHPWVTNSHVQAPDPPEPRLVFH
jgi:serine/threonine protein kinase